MASEGDEDKPKQKVTVATSTHTLYYAPDLPDVGDMTKVTTEEVPAWTVESDRGVRVKVMRKGGNLVELSKDGHPYVWDNTEGAIYYGVSGVYINGGVRFAAVTPEHGLYHDTLWDVTFEQSEEEQSRSIILSITDSSEQRQKLNDTLSQGKYSLPDGAPRSRELRQGSDTDDLQRRQPDIPREPEQQPH